MYAAELLDVIRKDWRAGRPFVEWVAAHVAGARRSYACDQAVVPPSTIRSVPTQ